MDEKVDEKVAVQVQATKTVNAVAQPETKWRGLGTHKSIRGDDEGCSLLADGTWVVDVAAPAVRCLEWAIGGRRQEEGGRRAMAKSHEVLRR
ncbi:hypothetical protein GQ55_4G121100 [Panicum hallii var. hallii]|uniref:Uncharacterized protein n=1 Tax=Panicum hallii var. hallii TaxID=1504633 RepID=A0A2T7DXT1_9POAL|nr:hypothetical protein GQ55_4G121100 [Panicum hallii var. hallii]